METKNLTSNERANLEAIKNQTAWFTGFAWVFVALGFLAAIPGLFKLWHDGYSLSNLSALGSYFQGAVGSLWALASFLFIYVAFLGQKLQLALQREELEHQRVQFEIQETNQAAQLKEQREQFVLQRDSIKRQNFESAFYELLRFQNQITEQMERSIRVRSGGDVHSEVRQGRGCFLVWYKVMVDTFRAYAKTAEQKKSDEFALKLYSQFYSDYHHKLGHYFRTLYHVFKFVKESDAVAASEKRRYTSLVRAQLSTGELTLLFYNCLSDYGKKFKPLVEEFGLFEHIDESFLLDESDKAFYKPSAYE
jgi:hypothetical protein